MLGCMLCHQFSSADRELKGYDFCLSHYYLKENVPSFPSWMQSACKRHMLTLVQNCEVIGWMPVAIYLYDLIGPDILGNRLEMYCYN